MTIKQKFKGKFIKALKEIDKSEETLTNNLIELNKTKQEYLNVYKKLLENKLFYTNYDEIVFVREVSLSEEYYDSMPRIICDLLYADNINFNYKSSVARKYLTEWYEDSAGTKTAEELKGNEILKGFVFNVLSDSYYRKIKIK